MRIGFIGTGHIAAPMVRFLAVKGHQITVSERGAQTAGALSRSHGVTVLPNQGVLDACDVVFLCVRPQHAHAVVSDMIFRADHHVVSVMAGISIQDLHLWCAPASRITLTIPLGYLEQGGCPLPACPDGTLLTQLFSPENPVITVPSENALNQHFAICAMVPGILDLLATASDWLGQQTGAPAEAEAYTAQLMSGYLATLPRTPGALAVARDELATDGTISLHMTNALRQGQAHDVLTKAMAAISSRLTGSNEQT